MKFGEALELLRKCQRIARTAWPTGEYLQLAHYAEIRCKDHKGYETSASYPSGVDLWIVKRLASNVLQPWHPEPFDLLATDWIGGAAPMRPAFSVGTKVNLKDTGGTWHGVIVQAVDQKPGMATIEFNNAPADEGYEPGQRFELPEIWLERS